MKNRTYYLPMPLQILLAAITFSIVFISCPPIEDETFENTITLSGDLYSTTWTDTLDKIYKDGVPVKVDLSACTVPASGSDILKHVNEDGSDYTLDELNPYNNYIQFNASFGSRFGKQLITTLILPDVATMINNASNNISIVSIEDAKNDETDRYAFRHYSTLRSVSGKKISLVGTFAFYNCKTLKDVNFPEAVIVMQYSFFGCTSLKNMRIETVRYIHQSAFENCSSLEKVECFDATSIEHRAFKNCTNLTEVVFPRARAIRTEAFRNCTSLKAARFHASPIRTTEPSHPLDPYKSKTGIFTADTLAFHDNAFRGCKKLEVLDVRNAWNVYFAGGALADIGTHLELHLFDDNGDISFGHPQLDIYFGDMDKEDPHDKGQVTLKTVTIRAPTVPAGESRIEKDDPDDHYKQGIVSDIKSRYAVDGNDENGKAIKKPVITVTVIRGPAS